MPEERNRMSSGSLNSASFGGNWLFEKPWANNKEERGNIRETSDSFKKPKAVLWMRSD